MKVESCIFDILFYELWVHIETVALIFCLEFDNLLLIYLFIRMAF